MNRRQFLKTASAGAAAVLAPQDAEAANPLSNYAMRDQNGQAFNTAQLGAKPTIVMFGYNGCEFCGEKLSPTLATVQRQLKADGRDANLVVISIHPETDFNNRSAYMQRYAATGMQPQNFTLLFPKDQATAYEIHDKLGLYRQRSNPNSHAGTLIILDGGGTVRNRVNAAIEPEETLKMREVARQVSAAVGALQRGR